MTGNIQSNYVNDITDSRGIMGACRKRGRSFGYGKGCYADLFQKELGK